MKSKFCILFIALLCSSLLGFSQYEFLQMPTVDGKIQTFPTFNSCSFYFYTGEAVVRMEYKSAKETSWRNAHATVCDVPEKIHKGSLFNLNEDTDYQIRILAGKDNNVVGQATFRTQTSTPRIAKTIDLSTLPRVGQNGIVITEQGEPDAWIKYTAPPNWILRRTPRNADTLDAAIVLNGAKYIIIENLTIEGGKRHGILVENCAHVRILNCDISGWGRLGVQQFVNGEFCGQYLDDEGQWIDYDGAIQVRRSYGTVVERCYVHDPRSRSNSWVFSHPTGPQAMVVDQTLGGNVIRWNDFVGSDEHRWNDVIECLRNGSPDGGLFRDSDISGNYLAFGNDDGIEMEGGGMNLRFTGNKIEGTLAGVSLAPTLLGPQFVIGNLITNPGDEEGLTLMFVKNNMGGPAQKGKRFLYNNTFHGNDESASVYSNYGNNTPPTAGLGTMRNNIFVCNESRTQGDWVRAENFDHNLYWVRNSLTDSERFMTYLHNSGQEKNGFIANPLFFDPSAGNFRLLPTSPARGKAVEVVGITRAGDDLGAFFNGINDLPVRPLAFTASPAQVNFAATGGVETVRLSLPANAAEPVTFQIRKNKVFDWFSVTPSTGTIKPGETLNLTVTVNQARITGRPLFRGAFLVRTANGLSRPVSIYAKGIYTEDKRPAKAPNTVYLRPEDVANEASITIPKDGNYAVLARIIRSPRTVAANTPAQQGRVQRLETVINGQSVRNNSTTGDWYIKEDVERVIYLCALGNLKAGSNRLSVKSNMSNTTVIAYIVTDNPLEFFLQGRYTGSRPAMNVTVPGEVTAPYPTIINLAVEWEIEGDDNLNAVCNVKYRKTGDADWRDAMPLRRIPAGESIGTRPIFTWTNRLSGSIFDLKPDTEYEIKLNLKDPDGGEAEKTVKARTRPVPKAAANAPVRKVNPSTIHTVKPGEIGLLADGDYGSFVAQTDGEPGKPVVYRAVGKGAKFNTISLTGRKHVYLEGLVVRTDTVDSRKNHQTAINLLGAEDCVVRRCDIKGVYGIRASSKPGAKNCYIADNVVNGITPWISEAMGANGQNIGEGIEITGPGNVICHNYVCGFRDCISFMEDTWTFDQYCIDVYNNDINIGSDDAIEADFAMSNCRILRNRITNSFVGLSSQPGLGGPTYFIRNVMYNLTYVPFKLHRRSYGDVVLHNTIVKSGDGLVCFAQFDHALFRNNIAIGGPAGGERWGGYGGGDGSAVNLQPGLYSDVDYDAVGAWNIPFRGRIGDQNFSSEEEMRQGPREKNGIVVTLDVFKKVAFPDKPGSLYAPPDLRPKAGSAVVNAGIIIPNVNDRFKGKAPAIGAYEADEPLPTYGPRPKGVDESNMSYFYQ